MHFAFRRVRHKSQIFADGANGADFKALQINCNVGFDAE